MSHAEIELARQAKVVLTNPAYEEAYRRYREKIVAELQAADPLNIALVMTLKRHLSSLAIVRKNLEIIMADGLEAQAKLDFERTSLAAKAKSALRRIA